FQAHPDDCRNLLPSHSWRGGRWENFDHWPYLGWHAVQWNGGEFEIALAPSTYATEDAIVLAVGAQPLPPFVQELLDWCERPTGRALQFANGWVCASVLESQLCKVTWEDI